MTGLIFLLLKFSSRLNAASTIVCTRAALRPRLSTAKGNETFSKPREMASSMPLKECYIMQNS